ncbi:type II toxin-antitoxin system tRNA(fMet)-specific endonuclease VapC [Aphanothece sacrum]|uniref:PIN domain-containing protein n=1 Tax=Aphanothece sacrum FPU1 TaxID=1920663 RepID=A0A401INF1_APHSA|nr:type II toxin-antitoxin system VapC family toxin [Aphanothece sacrum]GBF82790.1 hypothetical protein AsFPU1_4224 [Aphanothece sacrum FPU1]GBF85801.1 virulence associated protein C [Aphanothece sacrum FPU3]
MKYLLDTNICIYLIKKKPFKVFEKFKNIEPGDIGVSSITVAELKYGVYKSQHLEKNKVALTQFLIPLEIVSFDVNATVIYGQIRANLEREGMIIGAMDMLIAAQAVALDLILITNNIKEFTRVPNLKLENWID